MDMNDTKQLHVAPSLQLSTDPAHPDPQWMDAYWMPSTGNRDYKSRPRMLVSAQGCFYTSADGRQIFDGLSGLWCSGLGHARAEISAAVSQQISKLDFSPPFQFGHPLAFELANKLVELTPSGLSRVFFTGSGSAKR